MCWTSDSLKTVLCYPQPFDLVGWGGNQVGKMLEFSREELPEAETFLQPVFSRYMVVYTPEDVTAGFHNSLGGLVNRSFSLLNHGSWL